MSSVGRSSCFVPMFAHLFSSGRSSTSKGGSNSTYNPQSLLSAVCCHAPVFKGKQQHDAHELMRMLLDGLQVSSQLTVDASEGLAWGGIGVEVMCVWKSL